MPQPQQPAPLRPDEFINAAEQGNEAVIERALGQGINPLIYEDQALRVAINRGHLRIVQRLLPFTQQHPGYLHEAIDVAVSSNQPQILSYILQQNPDPNLDIVLNPALVNAAGLGFNDIVRILLADPRVNPAHLRNYPLRKAASANQTATVALLLQNPQVDPTAENNQALTFAKQNNNPEMIQLLTRRR